MIAVDVALSETAAMADYVLPGRTAYESYDANLWGFNYPEIFFQLRRPVVRAAEETRESGWIWTSLAEKWGCCPIYRTPFTRLPERIAPALPGNSDNTSRQTRGPG